MFMDGPFNGLACGMENFGKKGWKKRRLAFNRKICPMAYRPEIRAVASLNGSLKQFLCNMTKIHPLHKG